MSPRNVLIDLGINGAFLTRRWEEPDNFMRLTRELGFPYHEFCADVIDPFFSGDEEFQLRMAREVRAAAEKYDITITDIYTGVATHRFHGLSHSDPAPRARMKEWIEATMDIALEMGTDRFGGHLDAFSIEVMADEARYQAALDNIYSQLRALAVVAKQKGMAAIYHEQMYIPSEIPWTIAQGYEFLEAVNRDSEGVPVYLTVDVGHQAGMWYGAEGDDLSYAAWLRHFAAVSEIVHLQQTTPEASAHWPFTQEYNERGHVKMDAVLEAIEHSHRHFAASPLAEFMKPVECCILVLEAIPGSTKTEEALLKELAESHQYLRRYVPEGGIVLTV